MNARRWKKLQSISTPRLKMAAAGDINVGWMCLSGSHPKSRGNKGTVRKHEAQAILAARARHRNATASLSGDAAAAPEAS